MKQLAARRARHRAIGADQPQVEAQRLRDWQGELVPAPSSQHDLNAGFVRPAQGIQIGVGDLDLGVQQRAININGDEADGALHFSILAALRCRLANDGKFQTKRCGPANGKLFTKSVSPTSVCRCRIWDTRRVVGSATATIFSLRSATRILRALCPSPRQASPDAHETSSSWPSQGGSYAVSTLARSRSLLPSGVACGGPARRIGRKCADKRGQCAYTRGLR